jgi:hypothetical protein
MRPEDLAEHVSGPIPLPPRNKVTNRDGLPPDLDSWRMFRRGRS